MKPKTFTAKLLSNSDYLKCARQIRFSHNRMPVLIECIVSRCTLWCPQKRVEFESTFIPLDERQLFGNIIGVPFVEHTIESDFYTRFERKCYPAHEPIIITITSRYFPEHKWVS